MKMCVLTFLFSLSCAMAQKVTTIRIEPIDQSSIVQSILPFSEGDAFENRLIDVSKKLLMATERFERVDVEWRADSGEIFIHSVPREYFEDIGWSGDKVDGSGDMQRACIEVNEPKPMTQERMSQITRCLLGRIQGQGFLDASVQLGTEGDRLVVHVVSGSRYLVSGVSVEGMTAIKVDQISKVLTNKPGKIFQPGQLDHDTRALLSALMDRGYLLAEVFKPSAQIDPSLKQVKILWRVHEGVALDIQFEGDYTSHAPLQRLREREDTFPKWFVDEIVDDIETSKRREGYLDATVKVTKTQINDSLERIVIDTNEGKLYRQNAPDWIGISDRPSIMGAYKAVAQFRNNRPFQEEEYRSALKEVFANQLMRRGYLDFQIRSIDFVIDRDNARVTPTFYAQEGDRYVLTRAEILGLPSGLEELQEARDLRKLFILGETLDLAAVEEYQVELQRALVGLGYLDAQVERNIQTTPGALEFEILVKPGPEYHVAKVFLKGLKRTHYDVLRREVLLNPGDVFSADLVRDATAHLFRLGIARSVDIRVFEKDPELRLVYVVVDIVEAARFRFEIGPGFGTLDGVRGVFKGTYANIGGTARRLSLYAKANRKLGESSLPPPAIRKVNGVDTEFPALNPEEVPFLQRKITLEYFEPSLFSLPLDGRVTYSNVKEELRTFSVLSNGIQTSVDYRLSGRWNFRTLYSLEFSDPFNVVQTEDVANNIAKRNEVLARRRLTALGEVVTADYLDDSFNPKRGIRSQLTTNFYDRDFGGQANFWQMEVKQDFFWPLLTVKKTRYVGFSFSVMTGFSDVYGDTLEVPVQKRFRVGGENSVRGFGEAAINPSNRVGGDSYINFMSEINFPLKFDVDALLFFDGGNAFATNSGYKPWDLRYGTGFGLRWNTPVGPLKIGYGFIMDPQTDVNGGREPMGHFYLGVGPL